MGWDGREMRTKLATCQRWGWRTAATALALCSSCTPAQPSTPSTVEVRGPPNAPEGLCPPKREFASEPARTPVTSYQLRTNTQRWWVGSAGWLACVVCEAQIASNFLMMSPFVQQGDHKKAIHHVSREGERDRRSAAPTYRRRAGMEAEVAALPGRGICLLCLSDQQERKEDPPRRPPAAPYCTPTLTRCARSVGALPVYQHI